MNEEYLEDLWDNIPGADFNTPGSEFYDLCEELDLKNWDE